MPLVNGKIDILYDARWAGNHGIGRFAGELQKLLPNLTPFHAQRRPMHPLDAALLGVALWRRRPKLFFSPGGNPPIGWPGPFVFTLCDLNIVSIGDNSNVAKRAYYRYVIRPSCHRAEFVLTISEYSRLEVIAWAGVSDEKVVNVGCGVGPPFTPSGGKYDPGYPYLLYVGGRKPHKNLPRLLEAYSLSGVRKDAKLVLSGHANKQFSEKIERLQLEKDVVFLDLSDDRDLTDAYRGALAFVFPSYYEGFGLPPLEAMACGVPVLTSNVCSIPEVVGDAGLMVDPFDVGAIADGIKRLVHDRSLREELRRKGLLRAKKFCWDDTARRTWSVLQMAAEHRFVNRSRRKL